MSELKVGDRVEVIGGQCEKGINIGDKGTIISVGNVFMGVDFDKNIGGHSCAQRGRYGYRLYLYAKCLKKIEEAEEETAVNTEEEVNEETKTETIEQKILKALREEIGVEIGEEFDVYENRAKQWTCKFEENGHLTRCHENGKFRVTFIWKYWIFHFDKYEFKKRLSFPTKEEPYFYVQMRLDNNGKAIYDGVDYVY